MVKMSEQESGELIDKKLSEIARLFKEIDEIADSQEWIMTGGKALLLLEKIEEWRAIREIHRKVKFEPNMRRSDLEKRASEANLSNQAQEYLRKNL